jgi:hypothetical protein
MRTITIHLDEKDMTRFRSMKDATKMTWKQIVFEPLERWEQDTK